MKEIRDSILKIPIVEGPIEVTKSSYPFSAMSHSRCKLDLDECGFVEEEYFLSSTANIYDLDENEKPIIKDSNISYKNRILVRKPKDNNKFSGRVYVDILNATNNYDIEDLWRRSYSYILKNNHAYIGITSKPVNIRSLKNFDENRYKSLSWDVDKDTDSSNNEITGFSIIKGTETGLVWDIISQVGSLLRSDNQNIIHKDKLKYIYLAGQSQSGGYINTYVNTFTDLLYTKDNKSIFDGYVNIVGTFMQAPINQNTNPIMKPAIVKPRKEPFISIASEADYCIFVPEIKGVGLLSRREDSDIKGDKFRLYEVAGSPHADPDCPVIPHDEEIIKTNNKARRLDFTGNEKLNNFPLDCYVNAVLENLHKWVSEDVVPPKAERIKIFNIDSENIKTSKDKYLNAIGGVRSPHLDVAAAHYYACVDDNLNDFVRGKMEYFSKEKMKDIYITQKSYIDKFEESLRNLIKERYILEEDFEKIMNFANSIEF